MNERTKEEEEEKEEEEDELDGRARRKNKPRDTDAVKFFWSMLPSEPASSQSKRQLVPHLQRQPPRLSLPPSIEPPPRDDRARHTSGEFL